MFSKFMKTVNEYPRQFWILMGASFIDRLGGALLFTFFSLYITDKFKVGLTEVGLLWLVFSITGMIGSFIGGALTDKFGRKIVVIASLVLTALSSLGLGLAESMTSLYLAGFISGLVSTIGHPAMQAMLADMLPEEQRADGFGIFRVVFNVATIIGPVIGGLLAVFSYLLLFVVDAATSIIMAIIVIFLIQETLQRKADDKVETTAQSFKGYGQVLQDGIFMAFLAAGIVAQFTYLQMYSALPVFLRDVHGVSPAGFGWIMSMNATLVVLFQFWITRKMRPVPPMLGLAIACLFYLLGFGMYGFVSNYLLFMLAMLIITIGEMLFFPTSQALVARLAPEDKRGRYMAIFGFSYTIPSATGTLVAGIIVDTLNPNWLWYLCAIGALIAATLFIALHRFRPQQSETALELAVGD
jgi:MFS family permease